MRGLQFLFNLEHVRERWKDAFGGWYQYPLVCFWSQLLTHILITVNVPANMLCIGHSWLQALLMHLGASHKCSLKTKRITFKHTNCLLRKEQGDQSSHFLCFTWMKARLTIIFSKIFTPWATKPYPGPYLGFSFSMSLFLLTHSCFLWPLPKITSLKPCSCLRPDFRGTSNEGILLDKIIILWIFLCSKFPSC